MNRSLKEVLKAIDEEAVETTGTLFLNGMDLNRLPVEIEKLSHVNKVIFFLLFKQQNNNKSDFN